MFSLMPIFSIVCASSARREFEVMILRCHTLFQSHQHQTAHRHPPTNTHTALVDFLFANVIAGKFMAYQVSWSGKARVKYGLGNLEIYNLGWSINLGWHVNSEWHICMHVLEGLLAMAHGTQMGDLQHT